MANGQLTLKNKTEFKGSSYLMTYKYSYIVLNTLKALGPYGFHKSSLKNFSLIHLLSFWGKLQFFVLKTKQALLRRRPLGKCFKKGARSH